MWPLPSLPCVALTLGQDLFSKLSTWDGFLSSWVTGILCIVCLDKFWRVNLWFGFILWYIKTKTLTPARLGALVGTVSRYRTAWEIRISRCAGFETPGKENFLTQGYDWDSSALEVALSSDQHKPGKRLQPNFDFDKDSWYFSHLSKSDEDHLTQSPVLCEHQQLCVSLQRTMEHFYKSLCHRPKRVPHALRDNFIKKKAKPTKTKANQN